LECTDVSVPVQSMVKNSQLVVPAGTQLVCELTTFNYREFCTKHDTWKFASILLHLFHYMLWCTVKIRVQYPQFSP